MNFDFSKLYSPRYKQELKISNSFSFIGMGDMALLTMVSRNVVFQSSTVHATNRN